MKGLFAIGCVLILASSSSAQLQISQALLGDGEINISGRSRKIHSIFPGDRRLSQYGLTQTPASSLKVVDCGSIAGLSCTKANVLSANKYTKCVNAHGVLIIGHSGIASCGADSYLIYMANVVAELLDKNKDGVPDDSSVISKLDSFTGTELRPVMIVGCNNAQEHPQESIEDMNKKVSTQWMSSQGYKVHELVDQGQVSRDHAQAVLTEEAIHYVQSHGWGKAYPSIFGSTWTSHLGQCTKQAQCVWYQHPENTKGCSNMAGVKCTQACSGPCASFSTPGQCYESPDGQGCAGASCDVTEFFNQIYQKLYLSHKGWGSAYTLVAQAGDIKARMNSTTECTQLLNALESPTYHIPSSLTGVYTANISQTTLQTCASGTLSGAVGSQAVLSALALLAVFFC